MFNIFTSKLPWRYKDVNGNEIKVEHSEGNDYLTVTNSSEYASVSVRVPEQVFNDVARQWLGLGCDEVHYD